MTYQAIIFDLDGTLLDSLDDLTDAVNHTMTHFRYLERTKQEIRSFIGNGAYNLIRLSMNNDLKRIEEVLSYYLPYYEAHSEIKTKPYNGIQAVLKRLKKNFKLGVVSNKHQKAVEHLINKFFPETFDIVIGERPNLPRKPDPAALNLCLKELNVNSEYALFVGDSDVDIKTGLNAGTDVLAVTWGFRDKDLLLSLNPTYLIDKVEAIISLLED